MALGTVPKRRKAKRKAARRPIRRPTPPSKLAHLSKVRGKIAKVSKLVASGHCSEARSEQMSAILAVYGDPSTSGNATVHRALLAVNKSLLNKCGVVSR